MTAAEDFDKAEKSNASVPCKVCTFLSGRADRDVYTTEFAKPVVFRSHAAILRVLNANGAGVTESGVKRHRRNHGPV